MVICIQARLSSVMTRANTWLGSLLLIRSHVKTLAALQMKKLGLMASLK